MRNLINLANDHALGYKEGSYSSDPIANRYFNQYKQSGAEFNAFKEEEKRFYKEIMARVDSLDVEQSSNDDDYSF